MAKKSKNQLRRERSKLKNLEEKINVKAVTDVKQEAMVQTEPVISVKEGYDKPTSPSELIFEPTADISSLPEFIQFKNVFDRFQPATTKDSMNAITKGEVLESDEDMPQSADEKHNEPQLSKKKLKKLNKLPISTLKTYTKFPELVEWYDVDATDPKLLIQLKSQKNSVPIPPNWQFKRDFLAGKRGFEKKPFELPKFIKDTGITDMRDTTKEDESTIKQRQRERVQPKMNRLDMDYQKLHDAFFKFQTKPQLLQFGDLYYEGRELEDEKREYKPGVISAELREALGISQGMMMPWVQKMQINGPPPSYPNLKIPGYNVPLEMEGVIERPLVIEEPFGKILSYEEDEGEEEEEDELNDEEEDDEEAPGYIGSEDEAVIVDNVTEAKTGHIESIVKEEPEEAGEEEIEDIPYEEITSRVPEKEAIEPKKLYQILKEKVKSGNDLLSSNRSYELGDKRSNGASGSGEKRARLDHGTTKLNETNQVEEEDDDDDGGNFKF
jgi:splicing factor 3B subunit 2